jgi:hypothetical protein
MFAMESAMIGSFHRGTTGDSIAIAIPVSTRKVREFRVSVWEVVLILAMFKQGKVK